MVQEREVVVVTGGSAGVGRAIVQEFARKKAAICVIARDRARLEQTKLEAEKLGAEVMVISADVADANAIMRAADEVVERFGRIDVWVNNAMASVFSPFSEMSTEEFRRVTEVTYLGIVHGTKAALKHMKPRNQGTIVQVGSALAYRGIPLQAAYCGAKHAAQGFNESVRAELFHEKSRIWLTMVQLPAVNTPQFDWTRSHMPKKSQPVPPIYQPEIAARGVYWAAHHRRRELNVGLSSSLVIFLNKFAPGLGDRYLAWQGFSSQQTKEPREPDAPENLFQAVPGPFAAHGRFDAKAKHRSPQLWMNTHRVQVLGGMALAAGAFFLFLRKRSST